MFLTIYFTGLITSAIATAFYCGFQKMHMESAIINVMVMSVCWMFAPVFGAIYFVFWLGGKFNNPIKKEQRNAVAKNNE